MRLGIIGLPNSGKTTLFNAITGGDFDTSAVSSGQFEVHTSVVNVPDERIDRLHAMYKPKKTTYETVTFTDIGGLDKGIGEGGLTGQFRNELSQVDGFVHVVRGFQSDVVPHPEGSVDPQRDLETLEGEFMLVDLVTVENRLERIESELRIKGKKAERLVADEKPLIEKLKAQLEANLPLRDLELSDEEEKALRGYGFLTQKPQLIVLNMGDEAVNPDEVLSYDHKRARIVGLQAALEAELAQLPAEDAEMFMEEYGVTELSAARVIRHAYELLSIQSFFTVGTDEVRAWGVPIGATAPQAAGAIHSDLEKGFIRAEVMEYADLIEAGSETAIKAAGKARLEGKDYIVKDGDIMNIRHSG